MKKLFALLSLLLCFSTATFSVSAGVKYQRVTGSNLEQSSLATNKEYIIVANDGTNYYAMGGTHNANGNVKAKDYRVHVSVTDNSGIIELEENSGVVPVTLEDGSNSGFLSFKIGDNYLGMSTSGSSYYLYEFENRTGNEDNCDFQFSVYGDGDLWIISPKYNTGRALKYNISSPRFSNYSSTYNANQPYVALYQKIEGEIVTPSKTNATLTFASSYLPCTMGETPTPNALTADPDDALREVTYSSNNKSVATVNATTGDLSLVGPGEAIITAAISDSKTYNDVSASYTVKVDPATGGGETLSSYTITFIGTTNSSDQSLSNSSRLTTFINDDGSLDYVESLESIDKGYKGKDGNYLRLGNNNNTAGSIELNLSEDGQKVAKKIVVSAKRYNLQKEVSISANNATAQAVSADDSYNDYTFNFTDSSPITVLKLQTTNYCFIKSVTIFYEDNTPPTPTVEAPTFSVAEGSYDSSRSVSLSTESGATIYYKVTDAAYDSTVTVTDTENDGTYSSAISVGDGIHTIYAVAYKGGVASLIAHATYAVIGAPSFSPNGGTFTEQKDVEISTNTPGASIYYIIRDAEYDSSVSPADVGTENLYDGSSLAVGNGTHTIYAVSRLGDYHSSVAAATFNITIVEGEHEGVFIPVKSTSTPLAVGDKIILHSVKTDNTPVAMAGLSGNYFSVVENVAPGEYDYIYNPSDRVALLEVVEGSAAGKIALKVGDKYLTRTTSGSSYVVVLADDLSADADVDITIDDSGVAKLKYGVDGASANDILLQFRNDRFTFYTSTQRPVKIYRYNATIPAPEAPVFTPSGDDNVLKGTVVTITAERAATITYTITDSDDNETTQTMSAPAQVTITESVMLSATATNDGGTSSETIAVFALAALDKPVFSVSDASEIAEVRKGSTVTITAPEGAQLHYKVGTAEYVDAVDASNNAVNSATVTITDDVEVKAYATISLNGYETTSAVATMDYMLIRPTVAPYASVDDNATVDFGAPVTFTVAGDDNVTHIYYKVTTASTPATVIAEETVAGTSATINLTESCVIEVYGLVDGAEPADGNKALFSYTVREQAGDIFTITDNNTVFKNGDKIVIANTTDNYVMEKNDPSNNNIRGVTYNILENGLGVKYLKVTEESQAEVLELERSTDPQNPGWYLRVPGRETDTSGKLYLNAEGIEKSNNYLKVKAKDYKSLATISVADTKNATIRFTGGTDHNVLRYNPNTGGTPLFSCYNNGQNDVQIFLFTPPAVQPGTPVFSVSVNDLLVNPTVVDVTCEDAATIMVKFVPEGTSAEDAELIAYAEGTSYTITRSGTLYAKGVNGSYESEASAYYLVDVPGAVAAKTGDVNYVPSTVQAPYFNEVKSGTQVTFTAVGADNIEYIIDGETMGQSADNTFVYTVTAPCSLLVNGRNTTGSGESSTYNFSIKTTDEPTFGFSGSTPEFADGVYTVDYGARLTITCDDAEKINYTVCRKGTSEVLASAERNGASVNYTITDDVDVTAVGVIGGVEGTPATISIVYRRAKPASPTFNYHEGVHNTDHYVALSGPTGSQIYYLIDGNPDTDEFTLYSSVPDGEGNVGIYIDHSCTVYAKVLLNGTYSDVVSATYTIQSPRPTSGTAQGELTAVTLGIVDSDQITSSSSYMSGSVTGENTRVPYSFNCAHAGSGYLQINSDKGRGIVTTFHTVGYVKSITVHRKPESNKTKVLIYGKNNAYTSADELGRADSRGELIAEYDGDGEEVIDLSEIKYKYIGIASASGTTYANYTVVWDLMNYEVKPNKYEFVDAGGNEVAAIKVASKETNGFDDFMVPYGTILNITATNASHVRYSFTEEVTDDVHSVETGLSNTISIPMTESHFVYAQGLIIGAERGTILASNTRDFIRVRVKPAEEVLFFPEPGRYREGTKIMGRVLNATKGTWQLIDPSAPLSAPGRRNVEARDGGNADADHGELDADGRFEFTLHSNTNLQLVVSNDDCDIEIANQEDNVGWVDFSLTHNDSPDDVPALYDVAPANSRPSSPIWAILVDGELQACKEPEATYVKKGDMLHVLVDGADYIRYIVTPADKTFADAMLYNKAEDYTLGDQPVWCKVDGETLDIPITDDCRIFLYGHNEYGDSSYGESVTTSWNEFSLIRPGAVAFGYPEGAIPAGRRLTINCPGADEVRYIITYESGEVLEQTVSGSITGYNVRRPVTIEAYGLISGADGPHNTVTYTIQADRVYRQAITADDIYDGAEVIIGTSKAGKNMFISNSVVGNNVPATPWTITEERVINPSDDVLPLYVEVINEGENTYYRFRTSDNQYMSTANGSGGQLNFNATPGDDDSDVSRVTLQFFEEDEPGNNDYSFAVGDVKIVYTTNSRSIMYNNSNHATIYASYNPSSLQSGFYAPQIYVLDPDARVYPPENPVFDPNIEGSYHSGTPINISSVGASTLYYFVAPEGYLVSETDTYTAVDDNKVTLTLDKNCTIYAYGANSAGVSDEVFRTYTLYVEGAPVFDPAGGEVDAGTEVNIYCDNIQYISYTVRDKETLEVLESDIIQATAENTQSVDEGDATVNRTTISFYVTTDCLVESSGIVLSGSERSKTTTTGFTIRSLEDRIYHQVMSAADLRDGDNYIVTYINAGDASKARGMRSLAGTDEYMLPVALGQSLEVADAQANPAVPISPYVVTNPPVSVSEYTLVKTGDNTWAMRTLANRYMAVGERTKNPGMVEDAVANATNNTNVEINIVDGNAIISFGAVEGSPEMDLCLRYNQNASRFKAYSTKNNFILDVQLMRRVFVPVCPKFNPDGGYYSTDVTNPKVSITSKYATTIEYTIYDNLTGTTVVGADTPVSVPVDPEDDTFTVEIPLPTLAGLHEYVIHATGINAEGSTAGVSKVYYFGDFEEYSLVDRDDQIVTPERYLLAYNHPSSKSTVKTLGSARADGSGIAPATASINEDMITVANDNTKVMRLELSYNEDTHKYKLLDVRETGSGDNVYISTTGLDNLGTGATATEFTLSIHEDEGSVAKLCVDEANRLFIAYYVTGGYFTVARENMIENSSTYVWPQLYRKNMPRILARPTITSKKDTKLNAEGKIVYGIGQRVITVNYSPTVTIGSGESAVTKDVYVRYTTDGTMPSATNGFDYTGPIVFSPGYDENGKLESLNCDFRAVAFAEGEKHSKSSWLQHYKSGIHVADVEEYNRYAYDKEHLYVIDGDLGIAFRGTLADGTREFIVFDHPKVEGTDIVDESVYNYLIVNMPAVDTAPDAEDEEAEESAPSAIRAKAPVANNAWQGMHGYHADFAHVGIMTLTPAEAKAKYQNLNATVYDSGIDAPESFEYMITDPTHRHLKVDHAALDFSEEDYKVKYYDLDSSVGETLNIMMVHRYQEVTAEHNNVYSLEGFLLGKTRPVFFVTDAQVANYEIGTPDFYAIDDILDPENPTLGSVISTANLNYFTIHTPIAFNHNITLADGRVIEYNPEYMDIFYTKYDAAYTGDRIDLAADNLSLADLPAPQDETSYVGNEVMKDGIYDYNQAVITALPSEDCGFFRYNKPFYVTKKGWNRGTNSTIPGVEIKAIVVIKPNAWLVNAWSGAQTIPADKAATLFSKSSQQMQVRARAASEEVTVAKSAPATLAFGNKITTGVDDISVDAEDFDADAVYYNLQGMQMPAQRVQRGFYIKVKGTTTSKVFVK